MCAGQPYLLAVEGALEWPYTHLTGLAAGRQRRGDRPATRRGARRQLIQVRFRPRRLCHHSKSSPSVGGGRRRVRADFANGGPDCQTIGQSAETGRISWELKEQVQGHGEGH